MRIIPAIDIMDGHCVQLVGGQPGTEEFFGDPVDVAMEWVHAGAKVLHVVDLDAALGTGDNLDTVLRICRTTKLPVHFGGGIRDYDRAQYLLESGIDRVILGTMAVDDYAAGFYNIRRLGDEFGRDRLIAAIDSKQGEIVVRGWQEYTGIRAAEFAKNLEGLVWGVLSTDVDVEGRMEGINLSGIMDVISSTSLPVIVSGGISSIDDIEAVKEAGAWGVVLGKSLYAGKIDFKKALDLE